MENKINFKLPKYELPKYDGQLKNWIAFWAQFKKIHDDSSLDEDDKFRYLLQSTKQGSPARELIESFPPSAKNYEKAIEQLKARFGNDDLLKRFYVRELLKLILAQNSNVGNVNLRRLYDVLVTQLRSLESLDVTTEQYSCFLFPLVESALPEIILREWERQRFGECRGKVGIKEDITVKSSDNLTDLLDFVKKEVECEERLALARSFGDSTVRAGQDTATKANKKSNMCSLTRKHIPTAAELLNVKPIKMCCLICNGQHFVENCFRARSMTSEEIKAILKGKGGCFRCLRGGHNRKQCKVTLKCLICDGTHIHLMCPEKKAKDMSRGVDKPTVTENNLANTHFQDVLLQTLVVIIKGNAEERIRVLVDTGSQRSYITKKLVVLMGYKSVKEVQLAHALFGGVKTTVRNHRGYQIRLCNLDRTYHCKFEALDSEMICHQVPVAAKGSWVKELQNKGIFLSDLQEGPIDLLIGADIAGKLLTGKREMIGTDLVAVETLLGWTVLGKVNRDKESNYMSNINLFCSLQDSSTQDLWSLDVIGIQDPVEVKSKKELALKAKLYFDETVRTTSVGRYEVRLPWIEGHPPLNRNFELAKKRLDVTFGKVLGLGLERAYGKIFEDWSHDGIIEEVTLDNWDRGHYLPHRPVIKENSTTPIRPVFDASASEKGKPSLNQCLNKGVNLIELIPTILWRFRFKEVAVIADVKKAFLQISLNPDDRDFLRFLWYEGEAKNLKIYRHARVVFGVTTSPFLLGAVFDHLLSRCEERSTKSENSYSCTVLKQLGKSLYVDNLVTSLTPEEVPIFVEQTTQIFAEACFEMRRWEYTDKNLAESTKTPVLGINWDRKRDVINIDFPKKEFDLSVITRRTILSTAQSVFDPIGLISPTMIVPKILIQRTWSKGGHWDSAVDEDTAKIFILWVSEAHLISKIELPRWFVGVPPQEASMSLHAFCDASQVAYATVIYLRVEHNSKVCLHLVAAKSRVAPLKKTTIPRLELLAATIGARLAYSVKQEFKDIPLLCWSDSTTVIAWIKREECWGVFVRNRVVEIQKLTNKDSWRHVPGIMNPADLASRGCSPKFLVESQWWEGPDWLKQPTHTWPAFEEKVDESEVRAELRSTALVSVNTSTDDWTSILSRHFSCYKRIVRLLAWVIRFISNCQKKEKVLGPLTAREIDESEKTLLRLVQANYFQDSQDKLLGKLRTFKDINGLLKVNTKIVMRRDTDSFREPIVLPFDNVIVAKLIMQEHLNTGHAVAQTLISHLREKYWIIRARQMVRKVVGSCKICKRFSTRNLEMETPALPEARVREARIFEVTGTDFAGPLYSKCNHKIWVCVFTCAVYRAVHFEMVSGLSTETLMMAFRRFVARRGRPSIVYSDNGSNYKGMNAALQRVDWEGIAAKGADLKIDWRFNPPTAAWWGGFWERIIGILKNMLRKMLGRSALTLEEIRTILCECEAHINSRPITYVSEDMNDPIPLTPMMFLQEIEEVGVPDFDAVDAQSLTRRYKYRLRLKEGLRRRFRDEYLGQLALSSKKCKNTREPKVGELVLVGADNLKRMHWPLAIVEKVIPGKDGKCRVVRLRTKDGSLCRPVQRIYPLELSSMREEDFPEKRIDTNRLKKLGRPKNCPGKKTRSGRCVKLPARFAE